MPSSRILLIYLTPNNPTYTNSHLSSSSRLLAISVVSLTYSTCCIVFIDWTKSAPIAPYNNKQVA